MASPKIYGSKIKISDVPLQALADISVRFMAYLSTNVSFGSRKFKQIGRYSQCHARNYRRPPYSRNLLFKKRIL